MPKPILTVISGPPGAGKSTLARGLTERLGLPAISRDELKQGLVDTLQEQLTDDVHHWLDLRALDLFFDLLTTLVEGEVSCIAEAAYQDQLWSPGLEPLLPRARVLLIRCRVDRARARHRQDRRLGTDPRRAAHRDEAHLQAAGTEPFDWPRLDVPTLDLTTDTDPAVTLARAAGFVQSLRGR
ncbi:MAG TPA: AAA family ATPase [Microlunatus sp.]|nr:AAA family ATPase [Microlunatus sp.]